MSAFIVSGEHIAAILRVMIRRDRRFDHVLRAGDFMSWEALADAMVAENKRSVSHRYPGDSEEDLPGPINMEERKVKGSMLARSADVNPVEALKLLDCYEYQSCEHPEWESSQVEKACRAIRSSLISMLPGYDGAAWCYETLEERREKFRREGGMRLV